jgi:hypothetical protein
MTFSAFDFDDLDTRTIGRIGFMTSDTGVDTFATVESEFMTFFTFGIMRTWVIQVILDWVVWLLWMEYFLDFTGFLFFGKFGVGIDLTDFLTGFFVHIGGVCLFCLGVSYRFIFSILFICYQKRDKYYAYAYTIYAIRQTDQLFSTTPV